MTQEGQRPDPNDELSPPVTTRASEEAPPADDVLAPPFRPGSQREPASGAGEPDLPGAAERPSEPLEPRTPEESGPDQQPADTVEPQPEQTVDEPFPFDMPWAEETDAAETPDATGDVEPDPTLAAPADSTVDDAFPFEAFDDDPAREATAEPADEAPDEAPDEPGLSPEPEPWEQAAAGGTGPEPWDAAGLGHDEALEAPAPSSRMEAATELAERLESLAARLRAQGADGVESELASTDRITSLLAALLAGFLTGRQ